MTTSHPDQIGCYTAHGKTHFYSVKRAELDRAGVQMARTIRSFSFKPGAYVLTISVVQEVVQFAPFEFALQLLGLYGTNADLSPFDAGRVESLARQFDPVAICGVGNEVLEGLKMMGHDAATVFKGRTVWARPDAYDAVNAMPDVTARRVVLIGPALALECARGSLHIDGREWVLETKGDEFILSSRQYRIDPVSGLKTGISGTLPDTPCSCGSPDPYIRLFEG
tara:strand:+ start:1147 stop:1818 length:672 start_codon:yes stop_codon:yes gene_type:complete